MADLTLIIRCSIQAVVLSAISNVIAQFIACQQKDIPFNAQNFDTAQLTRFLTFSLIACPPNVLWQSLLERTFPGYTTVLPSGDARPSREKPLKPERRLNKRNTGIKFLLDQSVGAALNTIAFVAGMALLRGQGVGEAVELARRETVPLMLAGQKLWPAVSLISFTVVPLEWRTGFGGVVGVFWGIYLSLVEGRRR